MRRVTAAGTLAIVLLTGVLWLAWSGQDASSHPEIGVCTIEIVLDEFSIHPDHASLPGCTEVEFTIRNDGQRSHELQLVKVMMKYPDGIPTSTSGAANLHDIALIRAEVFSLVGAGETLVQTVPLPFADLLVCNIEEDIDGELVSHYQRGMSAELADRPELGESYGN
jgi:hypothetical protein